MGPTDQMDCAGPVSASSTFRESREPEGQCPEGRSSQQLQNWMGGGWGADLPHQAFLYFRGRFPGPRFHSRAEGIFSLQTVRMGGREANPPQQPSCAALPSQAASPGLGETKSGERCAARMGLISLHGQSANWFKMLFLEVFFSGVATPVFWLKTSSPPELDFFFCQGLSACPVQRANGKGAGDGLPHGP